MVSWVVGIRALQRSRLTLGGAIGGRGRLDSSKDGIGSKRVGDLEAWGKGEK